MDALAGRKRTVREDTEEGVGGFMVLTGLVAMLILVAGVPVEAAAGESDQSGHEAIEAHREGPDPWRGSLAAEIGGGVGGSVAGGLVLGSLGFFPLLGVGDLNEPSLIAGGIGLGLGVYFGAGGGTYLAGRGTGGTGRLSTTLLASSLTGLGTGMASFFVSFLLMFQGSGIDESWLTYAPMVGSVVGSVAGGVMGYRVSATRPDGEASEVRVSPVVVPPVRGVPGRIGLSVTF